MLRIISTTLTMLALSTCVMGTDLVTVYQDALGSDPTYQAAQATFLSNKENVNEEIAALLPQISASGQAAYARTYHDSVSLITETQTRLHTKAKIREYGITLTQKLFDLGQLASLSSAKASAKAASATFEAASLALIRRTAKAYFNVLEKQDIVKFSTAQVSALKEEYDRARARFKVGLATHTDIYEAQASYEAAAADLIANQNDVMDAKEVLHEITGKYYDTLSPVKSDFELKKPDPDNLNDWAQKAAQYNFNNLAAKFNAHAAKQVIKEQFAGHLPTLNFTGSYNDMHTAYSDIGPADHNRETEAALNVSFPIFAGGATMAATQQARYNYQQALAVADQTDRIVLSNTRRDYRGVLAAIQQIEADRRAVKANESALQGARAEFKVGTKTMLDVLTQQKNLFKAQSEEASDRYAYLNGLIQLSEDAGSLTFSDLKNINAWLSPAKI